MGRLGTSTINTTLTNYARGIAQSISNALAEFIAPIVRVPVSSGQYKDFSDKNDFVIYETARALGGGATRIEFTADDATYNCKPQALEIGIDDAERDASGADQLGIEEAKVKQVVSSAVLSREVKVFTAIKAALSATSGVGAWSQPANDPILELDALIESITQATGIMPNRMVIGLGAWRVLRQHPKVLARFPGAAIIGVTTEQIAAMLLNPSIQIRVGILGRDTTKLGKTRNVTNVVGSEVFLFISQDSPTVMDPSFAKVFTVGAGGVSAVREYRDESARSDIYAVDWSEHVAITSSLCAARMTIT